MNLTNFKSYSFVFFLIISLISYYASPKKHQWKILLCSNIFFYIASGPLNFIFILITSAASFLGAKISEDINSSVKEKKTSGNYSKEELKFEKEKAQQKKRVILILLIAVNFGILFFLKYWNTLVQCMHASFLHIGGNKGLLLPIGISFYTFQSFAYFMDIYGGKYESEKNFLKYFLFISFFPQLIMGPINRYDKLGKQLKKEHSFSFENIKKGILLILFGAMKKYCIADLLAERISSVLDHSYENLPGFLIVAAILAYSLYQYADFSGGIDMVLGFAQLFGLEMAQNFRQPYFAVSLADFWRRWHISLGAWMRDYVFYPLVFTKKMQNFSKKINSHLGNHFSRTIPAGIANIAVFLFVGIWHGPELHFVIWGLYNGLIIAVSDMMKPLFEKANVIFHFPVKIPAWKFFQIMRTFFIINIGWYFDRISNIKNAFLYLKRSFTQFGSLRILKDEAYLKSIFGSFRNADSEFVLVFLASTIVLITSILKERKIDIYPAIQRKHIIIRWSAYYIPIILIILAMSYAPGTPLFMYAQY